VADRLLRSTEALGVGRWAVQEAARYTRERIVFDGQIGMNRRVQHPLTRSTLDLLAPAEALRIAVATHEKDRPTASGPLANSAKYLVSDAPFASTDNAM
jgi:acyl-CoA dehydrogenase